MTSRAPFISHYLSRGTSSAIAQTRAQKIIQIVNVLNLLDRRLHVIRNADKFHIGFGEDYKAAARIAVARLANAAHVDNRLLVGQLEFPVQLIGAVKIRPFQEYAGDVRVADEADLVETLENADEFAGVGVDVIRKNVLIDRPPRRRVHADELPMLEAHRQIPQELPAPPTAHRIGISFEAISRPETGLLGAAVEIERLVKNRKVMVAHQRNPAAVGHNVQTFHRVGPIADDVAQADHVGDAAPVDLGKDGGQSLEVGVNVTDKGEHRHRSLGSIPRLRSER